MRTVKRISEPVVLTRNGKRWTKELLAELDRCSRAGASVNASCFNKYKHEEIRKSLSDMYRELCCYCEARVTLVSYAHIEHRMPKRKFPSDTFVWKNLHFACEKCNKAKAGRWNGAAPILDACADAIDDHLTYMEVGLTLRRWPSNASARGETTIEHAALNRDDSGDLPSARGKVYMETLKVIREIRSLRRRSPDSAEARASEKLLKEKCKDQFGSVVSFALRELG